MINILELAEICSKYGCKYSEKCLLNSYTTFKIGGECPIVIDVNSAECAAELAKYLTKSGTRYTVLGKGSNIIASDKGYNGVILHLGSDFSDVAIDGTTIRAEAGASLASVCRAAQENGLSGMENLYGIPGTVGGGLFMNAGAYGSEMKDVAVSAEYVDENGEIRTMSAEDMELSYRHSIFSEKNYIITAVTFELKKGDSEEIKAAMTECMKKRTSKQPLEYPSAGSVFKRCEGQFTGKLIQDLGLKGYSVGGAMISPKHAGFIVNYENATAEDVKKLIHEIIQKVHDEYGLTLQREVIYFGD